MLMSDVDADVVLCLAVRDMRDGEVWWPLQQFIDCNRRGQIQPSRVDWPSYKMWKLNYACVNREHFASVQFC